MPSSGRFIRLPRLGRSPEKNGEEWLQSYQKKIDRKRYGAPAGYVHQFGRRHPAISHTKC